MCQQTYFDVTTNDGGVMQCCVCGGLWDREMVAQKIPQYTRRVKCIVPIDVERSYLATTGEAVYVRRLYTCIQEWIREKSTEMVARSDEDACLADCALGLVQAFQRVQEVYGTWDRRLGSLMTDARVQAACKYAGVNLRGAGAGVGQYLYVSKEAVRDALVASCYEVHAVLGDAARGMIEVNKWETFNPNRGLVGYAFLQDVKSRRRAPKERDERYQRAIARAGDVGAAAAAPGPVPMEGAAAAAGVPDFGYAESEVKPVVVRRCGAPDCSGVIGGYGCIVCGKQQCAVCLASYATGQLHECSEDDLASIKTMTETGRSCPKCGVHIQRTMGCATMFCVLCKTSFNYNSGVMYEGNPHNPHNPQFGQPALAALPVLGEGECVSPNMLGQHWRAVEMDLWARYRRDKELIARVNVLLGGIADLHRVEQKAKSQQGSVPSMLRKCLVVAHRLHLDMNMAGTNELMRLEKNFATRMEHLLRGTTDEEFVKATRLEYRRFEAEWRYAQVFQDMDGYGLDVSRAVLDRVRPAVRSGGAVEILRVVEEGLKTIVSMVEVCSERVEAVGRSYGLGIYRMSLRGSDIVFTQVSKRGAVIVIDRRKKIKL